MARFELKLPKMGESVAEATITNWLKQVGDKIEADEAVLEIATDKVDSEVPSEVSGVLVEQLFAKDDLVQVGQTIAIIETESGSASEIKQEVVAPVEVSAIENSIEVVKETVSAPTNFSDSDKFFSPLVKNIAKEEGISVAELENISGSGKDGRVTKEDILNYIKNRGSVAPNTVEAPKPVIQPQATINKPQTAPVSVNGGDINLGMAASLPNGNLIVPVIKNADQLNLVGMAKAVNDLGNRAKTGKLKPDDTQGGTYTVTNVGTFGSVFGTPIINQPQVGILALGAIRKVPAVIETPEGDFIGIRQKMFLSHSYDHRVVDGALGGSFVKRVAEYLEAFDVDSDF
jgi:pyruvate/2-oxoglutarate dehydrogenase complex dihydrolipoamide acyltransferase (E2) component